MCIRDRDIDCDDIGLAQAQIIEDKAHQRRQHQEQSAFQQIQEGDQMCIRDRNTSASLAAEFVQRICEQKP